MSKLEKLVRAAFDNATANGQTFNGWSDEMIAVDMSDADADIEQHNLDDVEQMVRKIRMDRIIGMTLGQAVNYLSGSGLVSIRPVMEDGKLPLITADYRFDRLNVSLVNGKIASLEGIG